jgi:pilus assembly protein Flp/PilA
LLKAAVRLVKVAVYAGAGRGTRLTPDDHHGRKQMNNTLLKLYARFQGLKNGEEGQDLVEYALLVALIALVCVTGVGNVATAINTVFSNISASLS